MSQNDYKIKVDKQALNEMMVSTEQPTEHQLKEFKKVVTIVVIKHFNKYMLQFEEFYQYAAAAVFERREKFDPTYQAYGYIYTVCRNEIGNKIKKHTREVIVEDILPLSNVSCDIDYTVTLPKEISKFKSYLTGEQEFESIEISKIECINLSVFLMMHQPLRCKTPDFFQG